MEAWWGQVGENFAEEFGGEGEEVVGLVGGVHFEVLLVGREVVVVRLEAWRFGVVNSGQLMGRLPFDNRPETS